MVTVSVLILLALVALRALSVIWTIVKYHGFRLRALGDDLRADYGLLTRVSATIPRRNCAHSSPIAFRWVR